MNAGFFVLRTPLLPYTTLLGLTDAIPPDDVAQVRARVRALLDRRPEIEEAIHVASPDLAAALPAWREDPDGERGRRAERSLLRYLARMSARPTPYGLFAGFGVGRVASRTQLCVGGPSSLRRHVRLDMEYVSEVVARLDRDPDLRRRLRYHANSSLYEAGGRLRYVEYDLDDSVRRHRLVAAEASDYLRRVLTAARVPRTLDELASVLVDGDVTEADALDFLGELVDAQLLVSELEPRTTGEEPVPSLIDALERTGVDGEVKRSAAALRSAQRLIESLREGQVGLPPARYGEIAEALAPVGVKIVPGRLLQVDLVRRTPDATLGRDVVAAVEQAVRILHRLAPQRSDGALAAFARAFEARYEGREVPLCEALDEESGIGFDRSQSPAAEASPLLAGVALPSAPGRSVTWEPVHALLLGKVQRAHLDGLREISLSEPELEAAGIRASLPLPGSYAVLGTVLGEGRVSITGAMGPSGARLLGRFCHADPELAEQVRGLLAAEEARDPERVYAEVVHLPAGRTGNVTMRPVLRQYEIPYLGASDVGPECRLPLDDLLVSVRGGRIVLRSQRLGREVVPRLTTAHNFALGISPYRFLCALQHQGVAPLGGFNWGPLEAAPFLPRVTAGKALLEPARWRLGAEDVQALEKEGQLGWRRLRERLGLPRHVQLREGDNQLPLDLENPLLLDAALPVLTRSRGGVLTEAVPDPGELCAQGPDGLYAHEFILPFTLPGAEPPPAPAAEPGPIARDLLPGSDWLYTRVDCGSAGADQVLQLLAPLAREAVAGGLASQWFFVRYADPDWHLRLRIRGDRQRLLAELLPRMHDELRLLADAGVVGGLRLDTYRREVERYGGAAAMEAVERIFWADSDCVAGLLAELEGDAGLDARWRLGLLGSDLLLDDVGLEGAAKLRVVRMMRDALRKEFGATPATLKSIAHRFGAERDRLLQLLRGGEERETLGPAVAWLERRSALWAEPVAELRRLEAAGTLAGGLEEVATSLVHMHLNRVLRSAQRANELVIYDLWERCLLVPPR
jgi:class I lanthipeptide synthase